MISVEHKSRLELDILEAGNLVAQVLQEDFEFISKEVNELKAKNRLSDVEIQDWDNMIEVRDAMQTLMKYYMVHDDYLAFMEIQRCYGNV